MRSLASSSRTQTFCPTDSQDLDPATPALQEVEQATNMAAWKLALFPQDLFSGFGPRASPITHEQELHAAV
jgi:hypothetical protein